MDQAAALTGDTSTNAAAQESTYKVGDWLKVDRIPLSENEWTIILGRIALSSIWLSSETVATNNLWLSIGTSAAGMITAMLLARNRA